MTKLEYNQDTSLAGKFIVATSNLDDDPFLAKKVIYILVHNNEGCMGVVVNDVATNINLEIVMKLLGISTESDLARSKMVYIGGPVECECGIVLHTPDYHVNTLIETPNSIHVSSDIDILKSIAEGRGPEQSMFFLGYAGWEKGQIEDEIKTNDWLIIPYNRYFLFNKEKQDLWQKAIDLVGLKSNFISRTVGRA